MMTPADTARLVNLCIATWPAGVRGNVWTETLTPLDYLDARATYTELRDLDDRPPSIARFITAYRERRRHSVTDTNPRRCELCDGIGWIEAPPERAHDPGICHPDAEHPCYCHRAEPCRCSAGQHLAQRWGLTVHSPDQAPLDDGGRLDLF